jgi:hypothetical protein
MGNLLNLERVPALAPKFANKIGKTCGGYAIFYESGGIRIVVQSWLDKAGTLMRAGSDGTIKDEKINLVEFERRVAAHNAPSPDERLSALKRKYELRLMKEFPSSGPASGNEADIQAWLGTLPFQERVALLKSQKDFEKSKSGSSTTA